MKEQFIYDVIRDVVNGRKSKTKAEVMLGFTRRSIDRLIVKYNTFGKEGFIHGNKGTISPNSVSEEIKNEIISLYENKYFYFNYKHFVEKLNENEGIKLLNSERFYFSKN